MTDKSILVAEQRPKFFERRLVIEADQRLASPAADHGIFVMQRRDQRFFAFLVAIDAVQPNGVPTDVGVFVLQQLRQQFGIGLQAVILQEIEGVDPICNRASRTRSIFLQAFDESRHRIPLGILDISPPLVQGPPKGR